MSEMTAEQKQHRRDMEYKRNLLMWLEQWVRILKASGTYIWDERDRKALAGIREALALREGEK